MKGIASSVLAEGWLAPYLGTMAADIDVLAVRADATHVVTYCKAIGWGKWLKGEARQEKANAPSAHQS